MSFSFATTTTTDPRTTAATRRRRSNNNKALLSRGGRSCATLSSPPPTKTTFNDDAILLCRRCVQIVVRRRRSGEGLGRKSFNAASASSSRKKNASYGGGDSGGEERGRQKQMQEDRLAYTKSRNRGENTYDFAPTRRGGGGNANTFNNRNNNNNNNNNRNSSVWFEEDEYETQEQRTGGGRGGGGGGRNSNNNNQQPRLFPRELDKFLVAGAFVVGIGAGVIFDTAVDLEPSNVASREILDRRTPSSEVCMANGASAMVFDQRVFLSLNPFNVYVAQPEVKPGCVLRRSNWSVLEREKVVTQDQENDCKRNLNTFAYVGDLKKSPEVSCVYHSEEAENQFMKDPSKAVLGDGVRGSEKGKNIAGGGGGSNNKSFR
jgi:hypothetical protein